MTCYPLSWAVTAFVMLLVYFHMKKTYLRDFFAKEQNF